MLAARLARIRSDPVVARAAPFAIFILLVMLSSKVDAPWLVVCRPVLVLLLLVWFWRGYRELLMPASVGVSQWLLAVGTGFAVFVLWIYLDQDWAVLSRTKGFTPVLPDGGTDWGWGIARLLGFSLVVPVMEELFWRSLVLRWIDRHDFLSQAPRDTSWRAFLITTALFAVEHERWLAGAVAGAAYNWLYIRTGNLWVPVVAHTVTNGVLGGWVLYASRWEFW
jgi:CAAX prenyl protease-like protein